MQEFGTPESYTPGEGSSGISEQLSEDAKQRFTQAQQQIKQIHREEKRARKRDDRVAQAIRQFMADDRYAHLFQLISRLTARDCPSIFILAILSLIYDESRETIEEYIAEHRIVVETPDVSSLSVSQGKFPKEIQEMLLLWTTRLALVLSLDTERILSKLMVDEENIDGTVLQLTTFVLVEFFEKQKRPIEYDKLQPLTIKILQDTIEPYMSVMEEYFARVRAEREGEKDDDDESE